ncbi:unnamed protein product [Cyclocybe aegerita]|uniref:UBC core domain-containing protein n=1 Tax=Cyclocybe aegerita TaxID=1973307 RepID=A0A8S0W2I5_CYCAE|nr:unnamed protein product [Cyclocybe aegerita]
MTALNKNNSAVKRIMQEARELANDPSTDYSAAPLEDDIFEWHCTLRGSAGTEFEGGLYHFRILLPAEYPFRPPSIMMLTPNGRFELNTKICISFTNYHEELWQPAWGVRTAIIGLQGFFPLKGQAAVGVGSIEYPATERRRLAALSREWVCPHCKQTNLELLPDPPAPTTPIAATARSLGSEEPISDVVTEDSPRCDLKSASVESIPLSTPQPNMPHIVSAVRPAPIIQLSSSTPTGDSFGMDRSTSRSSAALPRTARSETPPTPTPTPTPSEGSTVHGPRSSQKPPMLLDTAIAILLVLLFAIICRRVV